MHDQPRIAGLLSLQELRSTIRRTIVNDNAFEIAERLSENAPHGLDNEALAVVDRHHCADERSSHHTV